MKRSQKSNKVLAAAAPSVLDRGVSCFLYYFVDSNTPNSCQYFYLHLIMDNYLIKNMLRTQYT